MTTFSREGETDNLFNHTAVKIYAGPKFHMCSIKKAGGLNDLPASSQPLTQTAGEHFFSGFEAAPCSLIRAMHVCSLHQVAAKITLL